MCEARRRAAGVCAPVWCASSGAQVCEACRRDAGMRSLELWAGSDAQVSDARHRAAGFFRFGATSRRIGRDQVHGCARYAAVPLMAF